MVLVTLGDALLDVIVLLREPLETGADASAETLTTVGGQAANVAVWAAELGGEHAGPAGGRNGVVVSLVRPDGERTMASDRGAATELTAGELQREWFACDCLHISGYALLAAPIDGAALHAAELARTQGARISVDLSAWTRIREYGPTRFRNVLEALAPDVVFANEPEWEIVGGAYGLAATAVVKRGSRGAVVLGEERHELPPAHGDVVDATGAGDALAAGFLVGGPDLAAEAAARCVAKAGALP